MKTKYGLKFKSSLFVKIYNQLIENKLFLRRVLYQHNEMLASAVMVRYLTTEDLCRFSLLFLLISLLLT